MQIVLHGSILLLVGMLAGIPLTEAVTSERAEATAHVWGVVHDTFLLFGVWLVALGAVWQRLVLGGRAASVLLWSLVASVYLSTVVMIASAATGVPGLVPSGSAFQRILFAGFAVAFVGFLITAVLMVRGAHAGWRAAEPQ
jgi:hypothetical protein